MFLIRTISVSYSLDGVAVLLAYFVGLVQNHVNLFVGKGFLLPFEIIYKLLLTVVFTEIKTLDYF